MNFSAILTLAVTLAAPVLAQPTQPSAVLNNRDVLAQFERVSQLMESTATTAPGLARAAEPVIENVRQGLTSLRIAASVQDGAIQYDMLANAHAYLALSDALPKPHPFSAEGRKQFAELRESVDRLETHFRALLAQKETQLRPADRDNLRRYAEGNATLGPTSPARVVFLGDSITDGWRLNEYFPGKDYINRGIGGQVSGQMLGRMLTDVIGNKPAAMVVLAGTNDIARGTDPATIQHNLTMMADLADKHKIKPIFASILPIHDYNRDQNPAWEMSRRRPMETIRAMNTWIKAFCTARGYTYLDYFPPMLDDAGFLRKDLAEDGLHPNAAGYKIMAALVQSAIDRTLPAATPPAPARKKRGGFLGLGAK